MTCIRNKYTEKVIISIFIVIILFFPLSEQQKYLEYLTIFFKFAKQVYVL